MIIPCKFSSGFPNLDLSHELPCLGSRKAVKNLSTHGYLPMVIPSPTMSTSPSSVIGNGA